MNIIIIHWKEEGDLLDSVQHGPSSIPRLGGLPHAVEARHAVPLPVFQFPVEGVGQHQHAVVEVEVGHLLGKSRQMSKMMAGSGWGLPSYGHNQIQQLWDVKSRMKVKSSWISFVSSQFAAEELSRSQQRRRGKTQGNSDLLLKKRKPCARFATVSSPFATSCHILHSLSAL